MANLFNLLSTLIFAWLAYTANHGAKATPLAAMKNLSALCTNTTIELNKITEMRQIISYLETGPENDCPEVTKNGILELKPVVGLGLNDVCSMTKVYQIRAYHKKYIADYGAAAGNLMLPVSLRDFFLGFGLKISTICKQALIDRLLDEGPQIIPESDLNIIGEYIAKDTRINRFIIGQGKYKDLIFASELGRVVIDDEIQPRKQKIYIQSFFINHMRRMQNICNRSFKPVYEPLVTPLVGLSTIGFNLKKQKDAREKDKIDRRPLRTWFKTIFLCETFSNLVFVDFSDEDKENNADKKVIKIISEEQAQELMTPEDLKPAESIVELPPLARLTVPDLVLDKEDKTLVKAIDKLAQRKRRSKFFRKVTYAFKEGILSHGIRFYQAKLRDWAGARTKTETESSYKEIGLIQKEVLAHLDGYLKENEDGDLERDPPPRDLLCENTQVIIGVGLVTLGFWSIFMFIMAFFFVILPAFLSTGVGAGLAAGGAFAGLASAGPHMSAGLAAVIAGIAGGSSMFTG